MASIMNHSFLSHHINWQIISNSVKLPLQKARMAELVDARDLKSLGSCNCASSILAPGTKEIQGVVADWLQPLFFCFFRVCVFFVWLCQTGWAIFQFISSCFDKKMSRCQRCSRYCPLPTLRSMSFPVNLNQRPAKGIWRNFFYSSYQLFSWQPVR